MKNLSICLTALLLALLFTTCQKQETYLPEPTPEETFDLQAIIQSTPVNPDAIALEILDRTQWLQTGTVPHEKAWVRPGKVLSYEKTYITEDIAHYAFVIAGGSGENDKIGLHRVVKESGGQPVHTYHNLFYQHGDAKDFTGMMLPGQLSPNTADDFGMAVYLARNGVDVWGIDQAWALVPAEVTDHGFMKDWGLDRQVRDLEIAMAVARVLRLRTGFGAGRMILAGYSSGVATGFATVNFEAGRDEVLRQVKGFVPIDGVVRVNNETILPGIAQEYDRRKSSFDAGNYGVFIPFGLIGNLARTVPANESPLFPGFTNQQTALFFGAGNLRGPQDPFHYVAGNWPEGFPEDFKYITPDQWYDFLEAGVVWEAALFMTENMGWQGNLIETPWDDNFLEIIIPIFNVNAAGGFGKLSEYAMTLVGSTDITQLTVQLESDEDALFDFAHIDLFLANNAEEVAWRPILEWIKAH